jgi:acetylornithine/succinyldiaminopimelate/putrescine aminotransferase
MNSLLLKNCRILLPDHSVVDGSLFIENGRIAAIGEMPEGICPSETKDLRGALVMPAFVNAHGHTAMTLVRGLGGGLPIGAALLSEKVESVLGFGDHGSTFGGNPVAAAGAYSILSRIDDALLSEVKKKSEYIFDRLSACSGVESVSGMGLMIGIKTVKPAGEVIKACMEKGVLCLTAKDKVRLLPALNIPMEILAEAVEIIKGVCAEGEE